MAKSVSKFVIPTIEEVSAFMLEKMKWPEKFCNFYAEKFWHNYNSSGWRLSAGRGGPMKNWQSAVSNNWKMIKYDEDRAMLERFTPKPKAVDPHTLEWVSAILDEYRKDPLSVPIVRLSALYDWLKEQGFTKMLTPEQKELAMAEYKIDVIKGKATAVAFFLDHMVSNLISFNYYFNEVYE